VLLCLGDGQNFSLADVTGFLTPSQKNHVEGAVIENSEIWTGLEMSRNILCKTGNSRPIKHCYWKRSSSVMPGVTTNSFNVSVEGIIRNGYEYSGNGLKNGGCGISIKNVGQNDTGLWNCTLISDDLSVFVGTLKLMLWGKSL